MSETELMGRITISKQMDWRGLNKRDKEGASVIPIWDVEVWD